ncbi:MAG: MFS transporter, partial [Burkholderiaceae bacterium]
HRRWNLRALPLLPPVFVALFAPPPAAAAWPLGWMLLSLTAMYAGLSIAAIAYQSWGTALTRQPAARVRLSAAREGSGLAGVLLASVLPATLGNGWLCAGFVAALAMAALLLRRAPAPSSAPSRSHSAAAASDSSTATAATRTGIALPFRDARFRWLFAVFVCNGVAAAVPATLFLFFARDRLALSDAAAGMLLALYFAAAALGMPLWAALARRVGEARAWLAGMALAIGAFVWTYGLAPHSTAAFATICALSGIAVGADLALPSALLAGVVHAAGHAGRHEGAYVGAWNWATKLNLALAAGIALPLLDRFGYVPGATGAATQPLAVAYALLPSGFKLCAAALLWRAPLRHV